MKDFRVKYEWLVSATKVISAESEEEALEKATELTSEDVKEIYSKGQFEKGSLSAVEAWEEEK